MYYIKINGKIQPQTFELVSQARAEIERLRAQTEVSSWNILTPESAAAEMPKFGFKWHFWTLEISIAVIFMMLIIGGALALWLRKPTVATTHYIVPQLANYRSTKGTILGQLKQGTVVNCYKISNNRCQTVIDGHKVYIHTNVLQKQNKGS